MGLKDFRNRPVNHTREERDKARIVCQNCRCERYSRCGCTLRAGRKLKVVGGHK